MRAAAAVILVLAACSGADRGDAERSGPDGETPSSTRLCFRNQYPADGALDTEELIVVIDGTRASGEYNWIPAYKDRRMGRFSGSLQDDTISASYAYRQEGQSATAMIEIRLGEEEAVVSGGAAELGLDRTLKRARC